MSDCHRMDDVRILAHRTDWVHALKNVGNKGFFLSSARHGAAWLSTGYPHVTNVCGKPQVFVDNFVTKPLQNKIGHMGLQTFPMSDPHARL